MAGGPGETGVSQMQFVRSGPDVPERLLQAHEDERVVFFCGAGISRPAGLPDFKGLVEQLYKPEQMEPDVNAVLDDAIKANQYDKAVHLLDEHRADGRATVRQEMARILLKPDCPDDAVRTHRALLSLGRSRDGRTRLVTTNFDRLFERAISLDGLSTKRFEAPALPVPKQRWDGLVYLHGLLPDGPGDSELEDIVVSSGDFGLAYLDEGWAARFVSALFREFTVCFVGYSIEDPVLRYLVDALAADRLRGEDPSEVFAFGDYCEKEDAARAGREWRAKNVTPILYRDREEHAALHDTLREWADIYRDGMRGKERIVEREARGNPAAVTNDDNFVGRIRWALSEPGSLPAKRFAEMDPPPPLDWLDHLEDMVFLAGPGAPEDSQDRVKGHLTHWLTRHLNDHKLLLRLASPGGKPHWLMAEMIARRLQESPDAVPDPLMRKLWGLVIAGRVKGNPSSGLVLIHDWGKRFAREGLTTALRLELREILAPCVSLSAARHNRKSLSALLAAPDGEGTAAPEPDDAEGGIPEGLQHLLEPTRDFVLATGSVHGPLRRLAESENWRAALPALLDDFTGLLRDALDLMRDIGIADDRRDLSVSTRPSISEHPQNRDFYDWTALIELNRDAWLAAAECSPEHALAAAEGWMRIPYPVFRRLAFFAAARQPGPVAPASGLDWLLRNDGRCLWDRNVKREVCRLIVALSPALCAAGMDRLEQAVLAGPPRRMYPPDLEEEDWTRRRQHDIGVRLVRMDRDALSAGAQGILDDLSATHPDLEDEREEFCSWHFEGPVRVDKPILTPTAEGALVDWLRDNPGDSDPWAEETDDWRWRCRVDFDTAAAALKTLAGEETWHPARWGTALGAWSDKELLTRSWEDMGPVLKRMPQERLQEIPDAVSPWLLMLAPDFDNHEDTFLFLCERLLALEYKDESAGDDPVDDAINHSVGKTTEALLRWWYRGDLKNGQGLEARLRSIFVKLCEREKRHLRHGRVLLATHAVALFRVDPEWTTAHLLPFFSWDKDEAEAAAAWEGFLWEPRFHPPLMKALEHDFFAAAGRFGRLGKHGGQYVRLLTFGALEPVDVFCPAKYATAMTALPPEGHGHAADALFRAVDSAGDRREEYWRNRAVPWLKNIWPQRTNDSEETSNALGQACIAAGDAFPDALAQVKPWLLKLQYPDGIVTHALHEAGMGCRFPCAALELLDKVVDDEAVLYSRKIRDVLLTVRAAAPAFAYDRRFRRLADIVRKSGQSMDD